MGPMRDKTPSSEAKMARHITAQTLLTQYCSLQVCYKPFCLTSVYAHTQIWIRNLHRRYVFIAVKDTVFFLQTARFSVTAGEQMLLKV